MRPLPRRRNIERASAITMADNAAEGKDGKNANRAKLLGGLYVTKQAATIALAPFVIMAWQNTDLDANINMNELS